MKKEFSVFQTVCVGVVAGLVMLASTFFIGEPPLAHADVRSTYPAALWHADNGTVVGSIAQSGAMSVLTSLTAPQLTGSTSVSSPLVSAFQLNGSIVYIPSNSVSLWPTSAIAPGGSFIGNSNATVYLLTSTRTSAAWAATNKLGGP